MDGESSRYDKLESMLQDGSSEPHNIPLEYLRNITNNFSDERLLGEGGFGTVYKGVLPNGEMIAVKKLNSSIPGVKDRHFENEAYHLMRLKHPNVVLLVGWCSETENIFVSYNGKYICAEKSERLLCLEYMPKGSLRRYLSDEASGLGWDTRYRIIEGICYGLHYLHEEWQHSTPIIHMDLKPANILLDNNMVPKIADFGLSRLFSEEKTWTCMINRNGTLGYMAPEYINRGLITTKSDIFSLGVIIIEIVTGHREYPDENGVSPQKFIDLVLKKWRERLQKIAGYKELYYYQQIRRCIQIGLVCVDPDRSKRPTTSQIIKMLHVESVDLSGRKRTDHSPGSSFSEGADDDPLPGIEGLRITGEAFPARELLASGYPINGTTTCNFEINEAVVARVQKKTGRKVELLSPIPPPPEEKKEEEKEEEPEPPKPEEKKEPPVIAVVLKVHMHCEACAEGLRKRILKMKGVQSAEPDLKASEVTVKGVFEEAKLAEYVYKRTDKHAAIIKSEPVALPESAGGDSKAKEEKKAEGGSEEKKDDGKEEKKDGKEGGGKEEEEEGGDAAAGDEKEKADKEKDTAAIAAANLYMHYPRFAFPGEYYQPPPPLPEAVNAIMNNLTGKSYVVDREPHPSPGWGSDRPTSRGDRRGAAMADDRWTEGVPLSPGRDMDLANGPSIINYLGGPGGNYGVLRNPCGQPGGGLLLGPMHSVGPQVSRSDSDAARWQQKGLMPSPVTPMQVMHKAERKYVVGKVSDEEEAKQRQLKAIPSKLALQNFEELFEQVKEINIDSAATLTGVVSQIFDKASMEPTFCEMYANFCFHLAGALPDFSEDNEKITFKRLLLNKCQEEFERGEREEAEADKTEEEGEIKQTKEEREEKRICARRRMLGNISLIGELYKKRMLTERIMHECIKKLFGNYDDPDEENIEALCKLMSTIGEMMDHAKGEEYMDAYFDIMQKMSTSQKLSSRVRFMLRDSIDLRKNKWQQRRKVEGPKKIEEVHRDAAKERHAQPYRLGRGPPVSSVQRRGAPLMDYAPRGSSALASPSSQQGSIRGMPPHSRGFGSQDIRIEERHQFDSRTVPLPQRAVKDEAVTLGPQGGLARGMSIRGQPPVSNAELPSVVDHRRIVSSPQKMKKKKRRRIVSGSNGYNSLADRTSGRTPASSQPAGPSQRPASQEDRSGNKSYSEDDLREKSISAIREYYSAKDEKEVALCIEELNAPSFYPSVVSLWVNDSFERKDMERALLAKLFVSLCSGQHNLLSKRQLTDGLASVLASLEDTLSDAPRATEYLGRLLARFVQENILPLQEVGKLIQEGGEEPGCLVQDGIAADILRAVLDSIRLEKGDSFLNEVKSSSSLKLEDFRPQHLKRSKLDAFM